MHVIFLAMPIVLATLAVSQSAFAQERYDADVINIEGIGHDRPKPAPVPRIHRPSPRHHSPHVGRADRTASSGSDNRPLEGSATHTYTNGVVCECVFRAGVPTSGTMRWTDGTSFTGKFVGGRANGQSVFKYADGSSFVGVVKNGVLHGLGRYSFSNGDHYTGEFVDGDAHGTGKYVSASGFVFEGHYNAGAPANGVVTISNTGELYIGEFETEDDGTFRIHGRGGYISKNTESYVGNWSNGLPEGYGTSVNFLKNITYDLSLIHI